MTGTATQRVRVETTREGALSLVLDAGKGNVIDRALLAELRRGIRLHGRESHLRYVLLDHTGEHFSYGASVAEHTREQVPSMLEALHGTALELLELDLPVLCAVRGLCLGGGLELALLAERIFAAPTAELGQPEIGLGVFAPLGTALLPRLVGRTAAADLLLSGRVLNAAEAHEKGLVAELAEDPAAAARQWARTHLEGKSAAALRHATRALRSGWLPELRERLRELERLYIEELMATRDANEGIDAFLQKREPRWEHH